MLARWQKKARILTDMWEIVHWIISEFDNLFLVYI